MKRRYLISLLYVPLTLGVTVPKNAVPEKMIDINATPKDIQATFENAQSIVEEAIVDQVNGLNMNELWDSASQDIQSIIDNVALENYLSEDGKTLKEDAGFGNLFGGLDKLKDLVPDPSKFKDSFEHQRNKNSHSNDKPGINISFNFTNGDATTTSGSNNATSGSYNVTVGDSVTDSKQGGGGFLSDLFGGHKIEFNHDSKSENGTGFGFHIGGSFNGSDSKPLFSGLFGGNKNSSDPPLLNIFGGISGNHSSPGFHISAMFNNTGSPDLLHGLTSGLKNVTDGLFGSNGVFHFGNGTGLENAAGFAGSAVGHLFNNNILENLKGGLKGLGFDKVSGKISDFIKGITDQAAKFLSVPFKLTDLVLIPLIGGTVDFIGDTVVNLAKGIGGIALHLIPKFGAIGAHHLPGFLRYQTHEYLVDDLANLKDIFLAAMRVESPIAADHFDMLFDKLYKVLQYANNVDPSMAMALKEPTEDNIRVALQSLSNALSTLE